MATPSLYIPSGDRLHLPTRKFSEPLLLGYINRATLELPPQFHKQYRGTLVSGLNSAFRTIASLDVLRVNTENEVSTHTDIFIDRDNQAPHDITHLDVYTTVTDEVGQMHGAEGYTREAFHIGTANNDLSLWQVAWSIHKVAQAVRHG